MEDAKQKLNYGHTMILGTGFMVISMSWGLFNAFIPLFLKDLISSSFLIGFVMVLDNLAGMTIQPLVSSLSDRTWTKSGRRMPFISVGLPLGAVFFILLPMHFNLFTLMATVVLFDLSMSLFRGPTVALMPDLTPSPLRSKANGIINFMGGLGSVIAFGVGGILFDVHATLPFIMTAVFMVGVLFLLRAKIKEPKPTNLCEGEAVLVVTKEKEEKQEEGILKSLLKVFKDKERSALFLLCAIFCWFIGWNGIETFFTTYGVDNLGLSKGSAAFLLTFFSLSFLIFAIPSGFIATRVGRKKTILVGIIGFMIVVSALFLVKSIAMLRVVLVLGGICWALININSYPMVVEMSGGRIGAYTGLYYFFSSTAAVLGPLVFGFFMDVFGNSVIFPLGLVSLIFALFCIIRVSAGEAASQDQSAAKPGITG